MGKKAEAEPYLKRANQLLPTAPGHALLGQLAEDRGDINGALQHYQVAASSNSDIGKDAVARAVRLDLPRNPAKYIQAGAQADSAGNLYAVVQNGTPSAIGRVQVRVIKYDAQTGRAVAKSGLLTIRGVAAGKRNQVAVGEHVKSAKDVQLYKVVVESAELAQ
jgi:tetratricopeptide (TPR) repeat protein